MQKICTGCLESKAATREFWTRNQGGKEGWRSQCKICTNAKGRVRSKIYGKRWQARRRNGWLKRKYGITVADYERMLKAQGGVCKICHSSDSRRSNQALLCVDHCHDSGLVRGLLCIRCNTLVGLLETLGPASKITWNALLYLKNSSLDISAMERIEPGEPLGAKRLDIEEIKAFLLQHGWKPDIADVR